MTQTELRCRTARLDWSQPGGPRAADFGDVYYSVEDGLEETRAVFLEACDLPAAWQGRRGYVVGELGFGTGLNALALWQLWREHHPADGWLHFLSVEKHPLTREDAARALADWPQLQPLTDRLLENWPSALKGLTGWSSPRIGSASQCFTTRPRLRSRRSRPRWIAGSWTGSLRRRMTGCGPSVYSTGSASCQLRARGSGRSRSPVRSGVVCSRRVSRSRNVRALAASERDCRQSMPARHVSRNRRHLSDQIRSMGE